MVAHFYIMGSCVSELDDLEYHDIYSFIKSPLVLKSIIKKSLTNLNGQHIYLLR